MNRSIMSRTALAITIALSASTVLPATSYAAKKVVAAHKLVVPQVTYHTVDIDGTSIFYREAGPADAPVVLLLHGFPTSSHMFRNLIPILADKYRVIAPDYQASARAPRPTTQSSPTPFSITRTSSMVSSASSMSRNTRCT